MKAASLFLVKKSVHFKFTVPVLHFRHYTSPSVPSFPGEENFKGNVLHSHSFRHPEPYMGRKVLVLGCRPSGQDISIDVAKYAKSVVISHHTKPITCELPENVTQVCGYQVYLSTLTVN